MRKTIPEYTEVHCDICEVKIEKFNGKRNGRLQFIQDGLDHLGDPVCSCNKNYDLCDTCTYSLQSYIDEHIEYLKATSRN